MKSKCISFIGVPDSSLSSQTGTGYWNLILCSRQVCARTERGVMSLRLPPAAQASLSDRYLRVMLVTHNWHSASRVKVIQNLESVKLKLVSEGHSINICITISTIKIGLEERDIGVRLPVWEIDFSLINSIQTGS